MARILTEGKYIDFAFEARHLRLVSAIQTQVALRGEVGVDLRPTNSPSEHAAKVLAGILRPRKPEESR